MISEVFLENGLLWSSIWQSTVCIAVGLAGSFLLRRRPSRAHQLLVLMMTASVIVPLTSAVVKRFGLGLFVAEPVIAQPQVEKGAPSQPASAHKAANPTPFAEFEGAPSAPKQYTAPASTVQPQNIEIIWGHAALYLWATTSLILILRLILTFVFGLRLLRRALPIGCDKIQQAMHLAGARLGVGKPVVVYGTNKVRSPVIWCWSRAPALLVPTSAGRADDRVDWVSVLCHELAHWKRCDHITGLLADLVVCILPWNPLLWLAKKSLMRLSEQACDDWVVACGYQGADYAQSLLDLAPQGQMAFAHAVVSSKKGLAARVRRILQDKCGNPRAGVRWVAIVSVVATFLAVGVAFAQTRPLRTDTTRAVHFPRDRSLGTLKIQDADIVRQIRDFHYHIDGANWYDNAEYLCEAQGDVTVPAGKRLALFVNKAAWRDLSPLSELRPNDLYMLSLPASILEPGNPDDRCMPHIAGLTGLKVLSLCGTNISSKGLRYIKDFKKLERLYLPDRITNAGLADVAELHSLKGLYFKTNRVTNAGLRHLSKLTSLEELELGGKQIDDAGLVHLAKLKSLNYLGLSGFSDAGMAHLKDIPNLRILNIGLPGPITDEGLANLAGCTQLERISLHWNENITDKGASYLATMPSLKMIDLWHAHISDAGLAHLAEIKSLEYLDLPTESVTDKGIKFTITDKGAAYLRKLNKLKHLHFNGTSGGGPISDTGLSYLTQLHSLEELRICGKDITDAGMSHIAKLDNLKELSLFGCPISNRGLARLTTLKHLEHLNLSYSETSIAALAHLVSAMPNLTNLNVREMQRGNSVLDISGLTNLKQLAITLKEPSAFSDEDLACLAKLKQLKWLQLCPTKLTDVGMAHLAGLINIERINVGGPHLTDDGLTYLAKMNKLDHLTIDDGNLTDKGLRYLEGLKALTHLNIKSQNDFSPAALERLRRKLPGLAMLSIGEEHGGYYGAYGGRQRALNKRSRRSQRDTRNRSRRRR